MRVKCKHIDLTSCLVKVLVQ